MPVADLNTVIDKEVLSMNGFMNKYGDGSYGLGELNDISLECALPMEGVLKFRIRQPRLYREVLVTVSMFGGSE